MRKITIILVLFSSLITFSQNVTKEELQKEIKPLYDRIQLLQSENKNLKIELKSLNSKIKHVTVNIKDLKTQSDSIKHDIEQTNNNLEIKIKKTEDFNKDKISAVRKSLSKNSLIGIIGVLLILIISCGFFWILSKRQKGDKSELSDKIQNTKSELEKESVSLDKQLLDIIEKQLKVADKLNQQSLDIDHTFHKNSANELMRITNYANTLEPNSPEAIALLGSLSNLRNYFKLSKYEITDFTGHDYDERIPMKVKETIYDEVLLLGKEIISKTLKPQIKYKGVVIQDAEVITKYNN